MIRSPDSLITGNKARLVAWQLVLLVLAALVIVRLFYLQVIKQDYYRLAARRGQYKQYEITAPRGTIEAHSGESLVPLVLNEDRFTIYADPVYIKDPGASAEAVAATLGGNADDYRRAMTATGSRYQVLAKKQTKAIADKVMALKIKGLGAQTMPQRVYPSGSLAAQLLGFVSDDGDGRYGLEQAEDKRLRGQAGQLRAVTDVRGVPLAANSDNVVTEPRAGQRLVLTIDVGWQQQLEDILKSGLEQSKGVSGSAVVMEAGTGAIKAMANWPSYDPANFSQVKDSRLFLNAVAGEPIEVGSIMKPLTAAAALDQGVVQPDSHYYDPSQYRIDGALVKNIEEDGGPGERSLADILQLSLNTGATWLLMQMGGGQINQQARSRWYAYMSDHYRFGKVSGLEQGYEAAGSVPDPNKGYGLNIQYANSAFGQGMTATPMQMAAAFAAVLNGGNYYRPRLIDKFISADGRETVVNPDVISRSVVKPEVGREIAGFMAYTISRNYRIYNMKPPRPEFTIGGKTGTAQVPRPDGGYYDDRFNGLFAGFVGGDKPQYVVIVAVKEPKVPGYAGSKAAAPLFGRISDMLIDSAAVTPRGGSR